MNAESASGSFGLKKLFRLSSPWQRSTALLLFCLLSFVGTALSAGISDWEIEKIDGRQYIPISSLKKFYSLKVASGADSQQIRLTGEKGIIDLRANTRECAIDGVRIWLSFPALRQNGTWLVSRMDLAKTIEPALRPSWIKGLGKVETVVIDPGHGGQDSGAASWYGLEKNYALDIAIRVGHVLVKRGIKVALTRRADYFIPLEFRAAVPSNFPNSIFVSIHLNASSDGPAGTGIEVFSIAPRGAPSTNDGYITWASLHEEPGHALDMPSFALGQSIQTALMGRLHEVDRGLKRARFAVIRRATVPSVLVECGFLTNPQDSRKMATVSHREAVATAIADGITDYKQLAENRKTPRRLADYNKPIADQITLREDHEGTAPSDVQENGSAGQPAPPAFNWLNSLFPEQTDASRTWTIPLREPSSIRPLSPVLIEKG
ncbi:MAG TPA: N-acetylmuramoyl-L-alanine amidase [Chthoniobacterales bacterium]